MTRHSTGFSRRDFLTRSTTAAVAMGVLPAVHVIGQETQRRLGFAFVGIGSLTMRQLLPGVMKCKIAKPVALVSGSPDKAKAEAAKYGIDPKNIYNYENYDTIKNNEQVDVIYIVLPNSMHAEYTIRGAKAGKHILCEKPMANSSEDCRKMIAACREAGKKLQIGYRLRYETHNPKAIELVKSGDFGQIKAISAEAGFNIGDPNQWRLKKELAGGGSMMDIGIYALNATRYLSGEEPAEVTAMSYSTANDPRFKEVEETIVWDQKFPSGIIATCVSTYGYGTNRYRVNGLRGFVEAEPFLSYSGLSLFTSRGRGQREQVPLEQVDHFAAEMDAMARCVLEDKTPLTPGEEGLKDLLAIEAIYEAARTGRSVKVKPV